MEVEVYPDGCEERLGGDRAFIAHGDLSNPKQRAYRTFRKILKNSFTYRLIHLAGPQISRRVARKLSDMSYQKYHNDQHAPPPPFKAFAHQKFLEGFEIVILGHSHFPEEIVESINGRRCLYYNVGDWMNHRSFLRFYPSRPISIGTIQRRVTRPFKDWDTAWDCGIRKTTEKVKTSSGKWWLNRLRKKILLIPLRGAYGLQLTLVDGSTPAMSAALKSAIDQKKWIVVTAWTPSWQVMKYDVKFLADPKKIQEPYQTYSWIGRKGFSKEYPSHANF
jgi:predicted phosphodiesterase